MVYYKYKIKIKKGRHKLENNYLADTYNLETGEENIWEYSSISDTNAIASAINKFSANTINTILKIEKVGEDKFGREMLNEIHIYP